MSGLAHRTAVHPVAIMTMSPMMMAVLVPRFARSIFLAPRFCAVKVVIARDNALSGI